jgi:hypothetical protein
MEDLQGYLAVILVHGICQTLEGRDLTVIAELGGGRSGHNGSHVTDDHKAGTTLGKALIKSQAPGPDGAVPLLVTGGQRREHNAVLEGQVAHLDGLQQQRIFAHKIFPLSNCFSFMIPYSDRKAKKKPGVFTPGFGYVRKLYQGQIAILTPVREIFFSIASTYSSSL